MAVSRLTGHHVVKGAPGSDQTDCQRQLAKARRQLDDLRGEVQRLRRDEPEAETRSKSTSKSDEFPVDYDAEVTEIIRAVRPYTMTGNEKLRGLIQAIRYIAHNKIEGDIVECGVWRGGSMQAAARTLLAAGDTSRELFLFDTFEGMTEPSTVDVRWDGKSAAELLATKDRSSFMWAIASLDDVKEGFQQVPYPADRLHYVVGRVEDTIPAELPERIACLRLDTDFYESTKRELAHAYSRLSPGGVLIIDDYGHWAGSRKATDEFLEALDEPLLLHRMGTGRIGVRPFTTATSDLA